MGAVELRDGVFWVGAIDWSSRWFHGFETPRGTTYNAYLIVDETVALVDAVKGPFVDQMFANIAEVVDPSKIGVVVANHVEMDHSSGLAAVLARAPGARLVASGRGVDGLEKHYQSGWTMEAVGTGDEVSLGGRTLRFVEAPMVHWPDSMFTYVPQSRVLLPNDAFGQHFASIERFDDEVWGDPDLMTQARDYFANIVLPYSAQVVKALEVTREHGVEPEIIGPSHGVVWRTHIEDILGAYGGWCSGEAQQRILVVYDSMWGSTEKMAHAIAEGAIAAGVPVSIRRLGADPIATIVGEMMVSKGVLVGGPTLNAGVFPSVAGFLTYVKGLRPRGKVFGAFGSYGWAAVGQRGMREVLEAIDGETLPELAVKFVPTPEELAQCRALGRQAADRVLAAGGEEPSARA